MSLLIPSSGPAATTTRLYGRMNTKDTEDELALLRSRNDELEEENARLRHQLGIESGGRIAQTSLTFLAKIAKGLGFESRKQESRQELIGRALRELDTARKGKSR